MNGNKSKRRTRVVAPGFSPVAINKLPFKNTLQQRAPLNNGVGTGVGAYHNVDSSTSHAHAAPQATGQGEYVTDIGVENTPSETHNKTGDYQYNRFLLTLCLCLFGIGLFVALGFGIAALVMNDDDDVLTTSLAKANGGALVVTTYAETGQNSVLETVDEDGVITSHRAQSETMICEFITGEDVQQWLPYLRSGELENITVHNMVWYDVCCETKSARYICSYSAGFADDGVYFKTRLAIEGAEHPSLLLQMQINSPELASVVCYFHATYKTQAHPEH